MAAIDVFDTVVSPFDAMPTVLEALEEPPDEDDEDDWLHCAAAKETLTAMTAAALATMPMVLEALG